MINMFHYTNAINSFISLFTSCTSWHNIDIVTSYNWPVYIIVKNGMRHHVGFYIDFIESGIISPTKI